MADKILVTYDGDIKPLQEKLAELERLVKKVDASGEKAGSDIAKSFDKAEKEIVDTTKKTDTLGKEFKETGDKADTAGKKAKDAFDKTNTIGGTLTKTVTRLGTAIAGAFAVERLISFGKEATELARKAAGVERAFERLNNPQLLGQLRKATNGLVTDLDLMTAAVRAKNFQIPLEQLPKLFEFAQRRAQETGESVDYLVESIILGIGRKSPMILDNLGISAVRLREEFKGVSVETAGVGAVAQAVGRIVEDELQGMGENLALLGDSADKAGVKWKNLQTQVGKGLLALGDAVADAVLFVDNTEEDAKRADAYTASISKVDDEVNKLTLSLRNLNVEGKTNGELLILLYSAGAKLSQEEKRISDEMRKLEKAFKNGRDVGGKLSAQYNNLTNELEFVRKGLFDLEAIGQRWVKSQEEISQAVPVPTLNELKETVSNLTQELGTYQIGSKKYNDTLVLLKKATKDYEAANERLNTSLGKSTEATKKANAEAEKAKKIREDIAELEDQAEQDMAKVPEIDPVIKQSMAEMERLEKAKKEQAEKDKEFADIVQKQLDEDYNKNLERIDNEIKAQQEAEAKKQAAIQATWQLASELSNAAFTIANNNLEKERMAVEKNYNAQIEAIDNELNSRRLSERRREELIRQRTALEEQSAAAQAEIQRKQAINDKAAAIFDITIKTAQAIAAALAQANPVLAGIVAAIGAAQLATVISQPIPEFAKGVIGLKGKGTGTSDEVPAMLSNGESVMTASTTRKHRSALEALHGDYFDKYVNDNYVLPAMQEYDRKMGENKARSLAENLAASLNLHNMFDDSNLVYEMKKARWNGDTNTNKIVKAVEKTVRGSRNKSFHK